MAIEPLDMTTVSPGVVGELEMASILSFFGTILADVDKGGRGLRFSLESRNEFPSTLSFVCPVFSEFDRVNLEGHGRRFAFASRNVGDRKF